MNVTAAVRYPALTASVAHPRCEIPGTHRLDLLTRATASARRLSSPASRALALMRGVVVQVVADVLAARDRWRRGAGPGSNHPAARAVDRQVLWEGLLPRDGWSGAGTCRHDAAAPPVPVGAPAAEALVLGHLQPGTSAPQAATAWATPPATWPPHPRRPLPGSCAGAARSAHRARGSTGPARSRACTTQARRTGAGARCLPRGPGRAPR